MLKRKIKYTDYNDVEREEVFYFNLSRAELTEMELSLDGGMLLYIEKIVSEMDGPKMVKLWKDLLLKAYGEKSLDGKYFEKSDELSRRFSQTGAYSILFMELATNADKAAEFVNSLLPKEMNN